MKMNVYEDGDKIGEVEVDLNDKKDVVNKFEMYFGKDIISLDEIEVDYNDEEIYVGINELMYMWNN